MIGDSAYSGKDNLEKARDEHFELVAKLNPSISQGFRKEEGKFDYNKDCKLISPVVLMDEASMVNVQIFLAWLEAIGDDTKIIICGDYKQLPLEIYSLI